MALAVQHDQDPQPGLATKTTQKAVISTGEQSARQRHSPTTYTPLTLTAKNENDRAGLAEMSEARVELIHKMKESELRYMRAMKQYLAEQKSLREQLLALEGADETEAGEGVEEKQAEEKRVEEKRVEEEHKRKKDEEREEKANRERSIEEDKRKKEEEEKKRKEEEKKRKEEEKKRKEEDEKRRKEDEKRKKEDEKRKKEDEKRNKEEEAARIAAEEDAARSAAEEEAARIEQEAKAAAEAQAKLEATTELCEACEERNPIGFTFCEQCGAARAKPASASPPPARPPAVAVVAAAAVSPKASPATPKLAASSSPAASSPATRRMSQRAAASPVVVRRADGVALPQDAVYERLQRSAASEPTTATEASNKEFNKTPKSAVDAAAANDPNYSVLDLSGNTVFSMKKREYCELLAEALKGNQHITQVRLAKCSLDTQDAKQICAGLAVNDGVQLLDLSSNKINNDGAKAIAQALRTNTRLTELNLLGQPSAFGDSCLEEFVTLFDYNVTLTKIIWRLDSRKSFAINKLLVRNNTIAKWLSEGKDVSSLIPPNCHIPELAGLAQNEIRKARASSSAPRLERPQQPQPQVEAAKPVEPEVMNDLLEEGEEELVPAVEEEPLPAVEEEEQLPAVEEEPEQQAEQESDHPKGSNANEDVWWLIEETPNGTIEDEGRSLIHNGGEAGGKACISVGSVAFDSGVLQFSVCNTGNATVLAGVTDAPAEQVDRTDAAKNKQRYVCSFFNGKAFGPGQSFPALAAPLEQIVVRLDIDAGTLAFAPTEEELGEPAFVDLPRGRLWRPYFSLGAECSIMVI